MSSELKTSRKNKLSTKQNSKMKHQENTNGLGYAKPNYHLYILFALICILPLIVRLVNYETKLDRFPWFPDLEKTYDFFLFYKQRFFLFLVALMFAYLIFKLIYQRNTLKASRIFIPLGVYAFLTILSTIFSKYPSYSLTGSYELFESVFVLLGYCIVTYYVFLILKSDQDFKFIYYFLVILSLILSLIGVFQFIGIDFYGSELGRNIIFPIEYRHMDLSMVFGQGRVYLSLYNPNYVGVLCSMLIPILFIMTLMYRKVLWSILSILSIIGLSISVVGAQSLSGAIGLGIAFLSIVVFLWRYLFKYYYITIIVVLLVILSAFFIGKITNHFLYEKLILALQIEKTEPLLTSIESKDDKVAITYNGEVMNLEFIMVTDNTAEIIAYDDEYKTIDSTFDPNTGVYTITDERFNGTVYGFDEEFDGIFYVQIEGKKWRFTNILQDKTYYFVNRFDKLDKIVNPPAVFKGYERFASSRGYIWSRSIPLLRNYLLLGSGPDTFTLVFPQNDYLGFYENGSEFSILTKPHNMYIQMGVQTGVLSLIAFLIFYIMYFISSFKLYIKGRFTSFYARFGLAIFIGTITYILTGLANDSSITTAPIFWALMGVGIALNHKAKPLILKELAEIKEMNSVNKVKEG